ncbi:MFS transporter [Streptomyces sp. M54]|uniref:MFS transporter n=1 Tax=Streptomyces sp. M54 TaxID=2759525 RepID=UPI001A90AC7F|nr:MFS transporter [Streptomyces sp. M54]QSS89557.1 MFS transporter [Streptomyces sp. M54]
MSPSRPKGAPEAGARPARRWRKGRGDAGRTPLSGAQRALLAASFLITLGSFAVLPYMSVLLHRRLGLGLGAVGFVLAVASLIQFAGGVVAGPVAGRIGLRRAMLLALALRTAGFAAFVPGLGSPALAVGALLLVSAGAALYLPANKAYLVDGASDAARPRLLSASGSAFNAGMALGPPAAAPLVMGSPGALFACVTVLFALVGAGHALLPREGSGGGAGGRSTAAPQTPTGALPTPPDTPLTPTATPTTPAGAPPMPGAALPARGGGERQDRVPGGAATAAAPVRDRLTASPGLSPFVVTVLSVYAFMFFQHYLALYAVPRTSAGFYGAVLTGYAALLVVAQPLLAERVAALGYPAAQWWGFGAMAAGMAAIGAGGHAGIAVGAALLCLGEIVLFLKNDLEALARSTAAPASVFGRQRLAAGIGAFGAAVVGGQLYGAAEAAGSARGFWVAVGLQCLLLPVFLLFRRRTARDPAEPRAATP